MRSLPGIALVTSLLAACGAPASRPTSTLPGASGAGPATGAFAEADVTAPPYGDAELQRTLSGEYVAAAAAERQVTELETAGAVDATDERLRTARRDLAVRRRLIATLESCRATRQACPPLLDEQPFVFDPDASPAVPPPLTAPLRFDVDTWRQIARELHGRACACRTGACVDGIGAAIEQLEPRPRPEVAGDELASGALTHARECLLVLRGKRRLAAAPAE